MGKAGKRKAESKGGGLFDVWNLLFLAIAGGIGYCRYNQIQIPILDDLIRKALYGEGGGGGMGDEVGNSLADARDGKPIAVTDVLGQMNRHCRRGKCSEDYWEALPEVAAALKKGPGTWDRKPLKKEKARELDEMLTKVAQQPQARSGAVWGALRTVAKELLDVTPKSMKESLASRKVLKSTQPPEGSAAAPEPEPEEEEVAVDDLP
mmetsp:Transcript_47553/g.113140  ORF Transcript_47553/g.113140 Transcript_47553/m.113140 type:complete len:207 (-) Transcript_47553:65-685(-)